MGAREVLGILAFDLVPCNYCTVQAFLLVLAFCPPKSRNLAVRRRYLDWPQVMVDHNHHC